MTRAMTPAMLAELAKEFGELVYFYEFNFSTGTLRLTSNRVNMVATMPLDSSQTWVAIGGTLLFEEVTESADLSAGTVDCTLSGVDQTIIASLLTNHTVGRLMRFWMGHLDAVTKALIADPVRLFSGYMHGGWTITEDRPEDLDSPSTVSVQGRLVSKLSDLELVRGVQTNVTSHQKFFPGDKFFEHVPALVGRTIHWGPTGQ